MNVFKYLTIIFLTLILVSSGVKANEKECFEKTSRAIFKFNQGFDKVILKPLAVGYNKLPEPIKNGTGNFTSNIGTLLTVPNYLLQGEIRKSADAAASFVINTTVGVLGFGNPAAKLGFDVQQEDLGQTLGSYGFGGGCYFVMPILGPTTIRDSVGMIGDSLIDPFTIVTWREKELLEISGSKLDYIAVKGSGAVDFRGDNMTNFDSLEKNSLDLYSSLKSVYLQNRKNKINNSPDSDDDSWGEIDN
jgi:phospholipid-binding lipoprotein MlaA|tara:strand:+ start:911 stop:1651 length:741 start_codon:yes stop_codon:yes gene_type:complete